VRERERETYTHTQVARNKICCYLATARIERPVETDGTETRYESIHGLDKEADPLDPGR
jgi:hypothetical protein